MRIMAVKGYTREEMEQVKHKRRIRTFYIVLSALLFLSALNVVFAFLKIGVLGFVTLLIFLFLFVIFVRGIDALDEEGHNTVKFRRYKTLALIIFIFTFAMAVLRI